MKQRICEGTWEEVRAHDAELAGQRVRLVVITDDATSTRQSAVKARESAFGKYAGVLRSSEEFMKEKHARPSARDLLRMPPAERDAYLRTAAESAAPLYEADLGLPPHERELTALTALDGEAFCDDEP